MWTLEQGVEFIRVIHPIALKAGYSLHLGGGVLMNGRSSHDLDILAVPRAHVGVDRLNPNGLLLDLRTIGLPVRRVKYMRDRVVLGLNSCKRHVDLIVMQPVSGSARGISLQTKSGG